MKNPSSLVYVFVLSLLYLVTAVSGLECYQCTNSVEDSCISTTTCSTGQVCSNQVFKRYTLTTVYDKGCMAKSNCYALEDLNTDRYCSVTPSTCTYCCGSSKCNGAEPQIGLTVTGYWWFYLTVITSFALHSSLL